MQVIRKQWEGKIVSATHPPQETTNEIIYAMI